MPRKIDLEHRESSAAKTAWADYLAMGDGRSFDKLLATYQAREQIGDKTVPTLRRHTIGQWSSWHGWQHRLERLAAEAEAQAELSQVTIWRDRRLALREAEHTAHTMIMSKVREMLAFPVARQSVTSADGKTTTIVEPGRWSFDTIARLVDVASKIGRLATDQPTSMNAFVGKLTIREILAEIPPEVAAEFEEEEQRLLGDSDNTKDDPIT